MCVRACVCVCVCGLFGDRAGSSAKISMFGIVFLKRSL